MKRHPLASINLPEEQHSVFELAWVLICKQHELTSGVTTEKHEGEGDFCFQQGLMSKSCSPPHCFCLVMLERKWRLWNIREVGKNSTLIQSLCCQTSADIVFIFRGKLMGEENLNFPLAIICHWRKSYLQLSSWCTTFFFCLKYSMYCCIDFLQTSSGLIPETLVQLITLNYLW